MHLTAICKNTFVHCYNTVVDALSFRKTRNIINTRFPALFKADEHFEKTELLKGFSTFRMNKQMLLRMKLIVLFMFTTFLQVSASSYAQNVTLNEHNVSLAKVFSEIKEQTGYLFLYNQEWIAMARKVDIVANKAPLEEVLNTCFKNQPLTYVIVNKTIVLKLKESPVIKSGQAMVTSPALPVDIQIKGTVKDERGELVPGVSVSIKGTKTGVQTSINGTYAINVPDAGSVLVFSFVGYERQEIKVGTKTNIDVVLTHS
jgi:hypothetical protein